MTTTTDWPPATWTDTGSHAVVTGVDVASATLDGPIYTAEDAHRLAAQNARLAEQVGSLGSELSDLREQNERMAYELAVLHAKLDPLDPQRKGWTPGPAAIPPTHWTQITSADDLTERQRNAGLYRPAELDHTDDEGMPLTPIGADSPWPTWLGDVHHADATLTEVIVTGSSDVIGLRPWADSYAARPVERTVVEPMGEPRREYRNSEAWTTANMVLAGRDRETGAVLAGPYSELAPDRIHADEQAPHEPVDRSDVEALARRDKERRQREQRALTTGEQPAQAETESAVPEPAQSERRGRLRRMWDAIRTWDGSGA